MTLTRSGVDAVGVVLAHAVGQSLFRVGYDHVPDYHAFWSGVVLYSGILGIWWGPAVLTYVLLRGRTRRPGIAAGVVGVSFVIALATTADRSWSGWYWLVYSVLVLTVFMSVPAQRRFHDRKPRV